MDCTRVRRPRQVKTVGAFSRVFAGEDNVMELWKASSRAEEVLVLALA
jgi:hypothetical protein